MLVRLKDQTILFEYHSASQWPRQSSNEHLFRLKINRNWYCPVGKYSFFTLEKILELVAQTIAGDMKIFLALPKPPTIDIKKKVKVHCGECIDGLPIETERAWAAAPPHQEPTGRWHAWVHLSSGLTKVSMDDVEQ